MASVWWSEDSLHDSVLFPTLSSRDQTQVIKLGGMKLYPKNNLSGPL